MNHEDVRNFIVEWNLRFPIDRWWRKKHNLAFNSLEHRESSFLDQLFEYEEDRIFNKSDEDGEYTPNIGDWLKPQENRDELSALIDDFGDLKDDGTYGR